ARCLRPSINSARVRARHRRGRRTMSTPVLRAYQTDIVTEFHSSVAAGQKRLLLVAPTAAGKTVIVAAIIARAAAKQKRVLVIAHRRQIISLTTRQFHHP